jgi:hypothetical protein
MKFWLIFLFIVWLLGLLVVDSTDRNRFKKSGLGLYIDNATGRHYIKAGIFGGTIPRLDRHGNHICGGWEYENLHRK